MKSLKRIVLICIVCLFYKAQAQQRFGSSSICEIDTVCNYIVSRGDQIIFLPDSFNFSNNQRGFVILELVIKDSEKIEGWEIDLLRILENDSIVRNYSKFDDEKMPPDIEALAPLFDSFIDKVSVHAIDNDNIDPRCKIILSLKLIKN